MDIEIKNLHKSFGEQQVINDFSLSLPAGTHCCIMAPSGAGKTTLIRLLTGLEKSDSGEITGVDKDKIAVVFQEDRLIEGSDAFANVSIVCRTRPSKDKMRADFEALGLTEYEGKPVKKLSGGMKRRVALLRALYSDFDLLILDEPFKGLDQAVKQLVMEFVKQKTAGKSVLLITHDETEAQMLGAEIYTL